MTAPIVRIDNHDTDDYVTVVTKDWMPLARHDKQSVVNENGNGDLFTSVYSPNSTEEMRVRIATAQHHNDTDGFHIHGSNAVYADVPLRERNLTPDEQEWCERTFLYSGDSKPDTVFEFEMPHPESLRTAILTQTLDAFPELTTHNPNSTHRHQVITKLQERIEKHKALMKKLQAFRQGHTVPIQPEFNPEKTNASVDKLKDIVRQRSESHRCDFKTVTGFEYAAFFTSRCSVLDVSERKVEVSNIPAFDVVGDDDWDYCQLCGAALPQFDALTVTQRGDTDHTLTTCTGCAENDFLDLFTDTAVQNAKENREERRAQQETDA